MGQSGKAKKVAGQAATIAGATGLGGVAGTMYANAKSNNEEETVAETEIIADEVSDDVNQSDENQELGTQTNENQNNATTNSPTQPEVEVIEELQPITEESHEEEQNIPVEEEQNPVEEEQHEDLTNENQNESSNSNDATVNPDEIAEALIAEDQIDPNDIDMSNVVNFDEIGTVYTIEGDSYTAATFHDAVGNQLVMIDVDGDNTFDIVTDEYGNPLVDQNGELLAAGDLTVDDAESAINDDATYLAHNETDNVDDFDADSLAQDLIS